MLGGAGAAFCHFNKPLVSKLIMGDAGYAHSVTMNALSGISENSEVISNAVQQSVSAGLLAAQSGAELSGSYITDGTLDDSFGVFDEEMIGKGSGNSGMADKPRHRDTRSDIGAWHQG